MPRSYSFDHFQVPKSLPKQKASLTEEDKQQLSGASNFEGTGIHYGKAHAETEQILQARQMARQLEELAAPTLEAEEKFSRSAGSTRPKSKKQAKAAAAAASVAAGPTAPIGALPTTQEAPVAASPEGLRGVLDEGQRQLKLLQGALEDARSAASRLASLPLEAVKEAARIAAQRLHLVHA